MTFEMADPCRSGANDGRRPGQRVIEMQDADRLAVCIEHIVIAVGVKAVAAIVASRRHADTAALHFMDNGDAAPTRRTPFGAVLQVHIDGWQRDDGDVGLRQQIQRAIDNRQCLVGEAAAMAADDAPFIVMPHRGAGNERQRRRGRIMGLIDMEIDVEIVPRGEFEKPVEQRVQIIERRAVITDRGPRHATQQAA